MCGIERISDLDGQLEKDFLLQRLAFSAVLEGVPLEQLHGNEISAIMLVDVINGADARVVEGRGGTRLALETLNGLRVTDQLFRQELEGHQTMELGVLSRCGSSPSVSGRTSPIASALRVCPSSNSMAMKY